MHHASAVCGRIEAAIARRQQRERHIVEDLRDRCFVKCDEVGAVEANEAFLRGGPHVTVRRLRQRVDSALRKSLVDAPRSDDVLVKRQRRIDGESVTGPNRED